MKKIKAIQNADVVSDDTGRQYHIQLAPGELAEYILLVGEAKRAERASKLLTDIRVEQYNREYHSFTGKYKDIDVSILSTGMGPPCIEIAMIEIFQITKNPTFIRVGTCGGLQPYIHAGDMVISTGSVRLEDTSTYFVHEGYPAVANYEVITALVSAAEQQKVPYHVGITATASGFYGAQGRKIPGIHQRYPNLPEEMAAMNVLNFEMETATIFNLAAMKGLRASAICQVIANRTNNTFIAPDKQAIGEKHSLITGLEAFRVLHQMDQIKSKHNQRYWNVNLSKFVQ